MKRTLEAHAHGRLLASVPLALAAVGILVGVAWNALGVNALHDTVYIGVYHAVLLLAAITCLGRAVLGRGPRLAWLAFGLGLLSWTAGDLYWYAVLADLHPIPYPTMADAGYLGAFPCFYVGIVLLIGRNVRDFTAARWLDGVIGALATAALATALLAPALIGLTEGNDAATVLTTIAYPLGDLFLIAVIIGAVIVTRRRGAGPLLLIGAGLLAWSLGDVVYLYQEATGSYTTGWMDESWLVGSVLIAAAALVRDPRDVRPKRNYRSSVMPPIVFSAIAVGVLTWDHYDRLLEASIWLSVATLAAVVVRLGVSYSENKRLISDLQKDSFTDSLTGLGNRRKIFCDLDRLQAEVSDRQGAIHMFALFDLDGFKSYNDSFGHPAGDALLSRLGDRLVSMLPESAVVYRLGGDEFCFLVRPEGERFSAIMSAAKIALTVSGEAFAIGASGGGVLIPDEARETSDVIRLADRRMYEDKAASPGRIDQRTRDLLKTLAHEQGASLVDHQHHVAELALAVGRGFDFNSEQLDILGRAAEFHDIGKIAIPDEILDKPGSPIKSEWDLMRKHTLVGARLLSHSHAMAPVADLVLSSHERWDGAGYPQGLAGEEIPLGSRIILVCDAFHAMTTDRPHQPAMGTAEAIEELRANAGAQFDPMVVERFVSSIEAASPSVAKIEHVVPI